MKILVASCSLRAESRSRVLARQAVEDLAREGAEVDYLDLAELSLPLCDGGPSRDHRNARGAFRRIEAATGIVLAVPIYNYDVNAAAKNLIELTGGAWENKVVGFLCAAGGQSSYMSVMGLANSLMLDFRCLIVPRFVYATEETLADKSVTGRVTDLARELVRLVRASPRTDRA